MKSKKQILKEIDTIVAMYPNASIALNFNSTFQLVIAVALSAQTTDEAVNKATAKLFQLYPTAEALAKAPLDEVESLIHNLGLYRNKAKNIIACSQKVMTEFHGEVPSTRKELESLPGVGRKTASVVLSVAFHVPALAVDTHIERISKRLGWVTQKASVLEVEKKITSVVPKERWNHLHHQLIFFGRYVCTARKPHCAECPLIESCTFGKKALMEDKKEKNRENSN